MELNGSEEGCWWLRRQSGMRKKGLGGREGVEGAGGGWSVEVWVAPAAAGRTERNLETGV